MSETTPGETPVAAELSDCHCCGFENVAVKEYRQGPGGIEPSGIMRLCALCARTHASAGLQYRHRQGDAHEIMKALCYVGNVIISAIKATDVPR